MNEEQASLILYKASAGSGKTYTLAKEYLKIVIQTPYDYNKILAVTFTKKATAEMKSRIIENLTLLEQKNDKVNKLRAEIIQDINESSGKDISTVFDKNVSTALQLILHDYSNFNISTIDSFFQSIIRSFAKELDLPIGMEVELDTESVLEQAVQAMLKEYKTDKDAFSKWIEEYVFDLIEEDKSWKIERNINKQAKQLLLEEYQSITSENVSTFDIETYKNVLTQLKQIIYNYRNQLDTLTNDVLQKIQQDSLDTTLFFQGKSSVQSFIKKTKEYAPEANSYIQKMLNGESLCSSKVKDNLSISIALETAWNNYIESYIRNVLALKETHEKQYISAELVKKNIYSLALLESINTKIKEYKAENNLILISDTNQIISVIAQHEEVPFIFEKSATFLKYIMIDEFQDTSTLQWNGMLPLLLEILQKIKGIVLIVGDPKQSIYRWRGGNMELIIDGIAKGLHQNWESRKDTPLTNNFRSAKEIVEFNNLFFTTLKDVIKLPNPLLSEVLKDVVQGNIKANTEGFVQCKWLEKPDKKKEKPEDKSNEDDVQLLEIYKIIQSVHPSKKYRDIAILVRDNKIGATVANFLQQNNIPVVSTESLLLKNEPSIRLLIAAIEYVLHPSETFFAVKLNYLLAKYLQQENLEQYLSKKKQQEQYFFEEKMEVLRRENVDALSSLAINELVFTLMNALSLDVNADNYLLRFQDVVFNYVQKKNTSSKEFLENWEEKKDKLSIISPEGIDAVTISTIHKSKGLQYPVVIVPFADWSMKPKSESTIWVKNNAPPFNELQAISVNMVNKVEQSLFAADFNKELELTYIDNINLLYVAFTRPEEQLYILAYKNAENENKNELPKSAGKLIKSIVSKLEIAPVDNNIFEYGNKKISHEATNEIKEHNTLNLTPVLFQDFKTKIPLVQQRIYNDAQLKGNIVHNILSKIKTPEELRKAVIINAPDEKTTYTAYVQRVLELFQQQKWFDPKWQHITERDFVFKDKILRADRILLSENECVIIDYKTGIKKNDYVKQLMEYKAAYTVLFNKKITAYLLYIDTLEVQEVA
jgi:ATP-dependent exoDNAse (exonuclease V) beta subunit